ncbi:MAG: GNAT family N-acetyltransferase [Xanthobacteraceae bacterium]
MTAMPSIRDNTALSRFELAAGGVSVFMNYRLTGNIISLDHTETPVAARGRGLAPFVSAYLTKHPEYRDLVA